MPRYLIRFDTPHGERFAEWSTIVDAPVSHAMTEAELRDYHAREYGRREPVDPRIDRARKRGTSSLDGYTLDELIIANRAGESESTLTWPEIVDRYFTSEPSDG